MIKMIDGEKASLVPAGRREFKPAEINIYTFKTSKASIRR
jgi:hypothetical protein